MTAQPSLFALEQDVEVFDQLQWWPAKVIAIRLTIQGIFYEVQGEGWSASARAGNLRSAGHNLPGEIVSIKWRGDAIFYEVLGPQRAPAQAGVQRVMARALANSNNDGASTR